MRMLLIQEGAVEHFFRHYYYMKKIVKKSVMVLNSLELKSLEPLICTTGTVE